MTKDYYSILGVLHDADAAVIKAAYRALAQRYHPDRWAGDAAEAHRRMAELNEAIAVVGDAQQRAAYDRSRTPGKQGDFASGDDSAEEAVFSDALSEVEERWQIACSVFPDLSGYRERLGRISSSLAFSYVVGLLETKTFSERANVAAHLEHVFLERHFGTNQRVLEYARYLVFHGQRDAAKALNRLVDVLGSDVDASLLIGQIDAKYGIDDLRKRDDEAAAKAAKIALLKKDLSSSFYRTDQFFSARSLLPLLGYEMTEDGKLFNAKITVTSPAGEVRIFDGRRDLVNWLVALIADKDN